MLPASRPTEVSTSGALQCGGFRRSKPSLGTWAGSRHPESTCPPGTDINHAVLMAVQLLNSAKQEELMPEGTVSLIILLTDGDPTMGEGTASNSGAVPRLAVGPEVGVGAVYPRPLWL